MSAAVCAVCLVVPGNVGAQATTVVARLGPIRAFTHEAGRIAWIGPCYGINARTIARGDEIRIRNRGGGGACIEPLRPWLALSRDRVLWTTSKAEARTSQLRQEANDRPARSLFVRAEPPLHGEPFRVRRR